MNDTFSEPDGNRQSKLRNSSRANFFSALDDLFHGHDSILSKFFGGSTGNSDRKKRAITSNRSVILNDHVSINHTGTLMDTTFTAASAATGESSFDGSESSRSGSNYNDSSNSSGSRKTGKRRKRPKR